MKEMKTNARLLIFVQENENRIHLIKKVLKGMDVELSIEFEKSILYEEFNSKFYFFVIRKCK